MESKLGSVITMQLDKDIRNVVLPITIDPTALGITQVAH